MTAQINLTIRGISALESMEDLPREIAAVASRVVNQVTRNARARSSKRLRDQIAFGARYLVGPEGKIGIKSSSPATLESRLFASSNPRSLARFVSGSARGKGKVRVTVAPGSSRAMPGAFLLNISSGNGESSNTLLAVRSPTKPRSAFKPRQIGNGLWSLYGPSVAQALMDAGGKRGIWPDMELEIAAELEREFQRQIAL